MSQFNFGLDDIVESEDAGRSMARGISGALLVAFFALSSLTSYLFFSEYASAVGSFAGPAAAPLVAGVIGVICLDAGALAWSYVRSRAATSSGQMSTALVAALADLLMSLLASGLFIVLSTTLETGVRSAAGALTEFGVWLNYIGVFVVTFALIINFSAVFAWQHLGADTRKATQDAQLRSIVAAGRFKVDNARALISVNRTIEAIGQQLPAEAEALAARQRAAYLDATMRRGLATNGSIHSPSSSAEPVHSANGNEPSFLR
jgi:hypothetical protein